MDSVLLNYVSGLSSALASGDGDLRGNLRRALEHGVEIGFAFSFVLLHEPEGDSLVVAAAAGLSLAEYRRLESRIGRPLFGAILDQGGHASLSIIDEPDLAFVLAERSAETIYFAPIEIGKKRYGLLAAGVSEGGPDTDEAEKILTLTAAMIAQTLRIEHAIRGERQKLRDENLTLKHELKEKYDFTHIVGTSGAIRQVYEQVSQVARSNATVLLAAKAAREKS
jgi:Nif-specific regulatory protein